uniref:Protein containing DUF488 n=1 Tax=uncultured Dokdonia sp. TaxID=575653 RepID=H6RGR9_9FLAO|nr:conserved hypothetical protein [uncultured bacterium]CCG00230.1 protein containing DUF488 [uncultured Dokdonia sp.]
MYYRRKVILSLLGVFGDELEKIQVQKLLFLFSRYKTRKTFDFVPYKFGCFSFQANQDLKTLCKYGITEESYTSWKKIDDTNYLKQLDKKDQKIISDFKIIYKGKSSEDLIHLTYARYPYYTINSTVASKYLTPKELLEVDEYRSKEDSITLFTIGYEGISLEHYLNRLIKNNVKVLCDVRRNAMSMKYGFSKSQLKNACEGVGIEYFHIPEVGIESDKRTELKNQSDYDSLFEDYKLNNLSNTTAYQEKILSLLIDNHRIALTCFEAEPCQCHRTHLAEAITKLDRFDYVLEHL